MSHTPLDEPDGGSREGDGSPDATEPGGSVGGLVDRLRSALHRAGDTVRRAVGIRGASTGPVDAERKPVRAESPQPVERSVSLADGADRRVVSDTRNDRPVPAPAAEGPRDRPELVARWHEDRLTLSEPDEAGAQISSDTWSEVDP